MIYIKNIIFDLGGVLLKDSPISILKKFNIDKNTYNTLKIFFENWNNLDLGKETLEEKFQSCNFSKEIQDKYKIILTEYYKYRLINIELINIINKLKENNYKIYILSDNSKESYKYYKNNLLFKNIDGWIISCEYNTTKKDGILFDILLEKYNLNPKNCYIIDDKNRNIEEAKKHGIIGYHFNNNIEHLCNDMKNNNIVFY